MTQKMSSWAKIVILSGSEGSFFKILRRFTPQNDTQKMSSWAKIVILSGIIDAMEAAFGTDGVKYTDKYGEIRVAWHPEQIKETTNKNPTSNLDVRYSFRSSKSGTANDALSPYNDELTRFIQQKGDFIVDNFAKLEQIVNLAFDNSSIKATAYFGIVNAEALEKIKNSIPNLSKAVGGILFKEGRNYSIAATLDAIRHIVDEKSLNREDTIDYLDRFADIIMEFDSVAFDYYIKGQDKTPGLLFKKNYSDGTS